MKDSKGNQPSAEEFRGAAHRFVDWLADYMKSVEKYPVKSTAKPYEIYEKVGEKPPQRGESFDSIFADFEKTILPGITHWQHPSFFAYFPANTSPPSILAELLVSGLGVNAMLWETSPAATELEMRVMEWLKKMLGLPKEFTGVIQDTASTATLCALISAREKVTGFGINEGGFEAGKRLRVYASDQSHSSVEKGAKIAGIGKFNVVPIETDSEYRMIPKALDAAIDKDIKAGMVPACVVATVGTTSSTSVDPLPEIGKICSKRKIWLHVDAAFAGNAAILPEKRHLLNGIEYADSFVFNPHKWLFTNFDCSAYYVKDPSHLEKVFSINPEYLKTKSDKTIPNFRDYGIQLGRRFRALKLWFVIRHYGVDGLQEMLRKHIASAEGFAAAIDKNPDFERLAPVTTSLVCFRMNPNGGKGGFSEERLNEINGSLLEELNSSGKLYLTHTSLKGKYCLRLCVGQTFTEDRHVKQAYELIVSSKTAKKYCT